MMKEHAINIVPEKPPIVVKASIIVNTDLFVIFTLSPIIRLKIAHLLKHLIKLHSSLY